MQRRTLHFRDDELEVALRTHRYVRMDLPDGRRIDLRWADEGLGEHRKPFDGQIWEGSKMLVQEGAGTLRFLLTKLKDGSAAAGVSWPELER